MSEYSSFTVRVETKFNNLLPGEYDPLASIDTSSDVRLMSKNLAESVYASALASALVERSRLKCDCANVERVSWIEVSLFGIDDQGQSFCLELEAI